MRMMKRDQVYNRTQPRLSGIGSQGGLESTVDPQRNGNNQERLTMQMTLEPNQFTTMENNIHDGFSSTAGGNGATLESDCRENKPQTRNQGLKLTQALNTRNQSIQDGFASNNK